MPDYNPFTQRKNTTRDMVLRAILQSKMREREAQEDEKIKESSPLYQQELDQKKAQLVKQNQDESNSQMDRELMFRGKLGRSEPELVGELKYLNEGGHGPASKGATMEMETPMDYATLKRLSEGAPEQAVREKNQSNLEQNREGHLGVAQDAATTKKLNDFITQQTRILRRPPEDPFWSGKSQAEITAVKAIAQRNYDAAMKKLSHGLGMDQNPYKTEYPDAFQDPKDGAWKVVRNGKKYRIEEGQP